jgi:glycosyltransferase involved in cell wall biosynthesis
MKKITVTIGIPAYNEEQNIRHMLLAIFRQKRENFVLKTILVNSDASSDKTNEIVESLSEKHSEIKLLKNTSRKGKYFRVNELFEKNTSDVIIILDADIAFAVTDVLEKMIEVILLDKKAMMVAGHVEMIRPAGFVAKVLHTCFVLGDYMRLSVPGYDIAPNFHGAATAYRGSFAKSIAIPQNLTDPHLYIYLKAKEKVGFRYCIDAVIFQNSLTTVTDVKQLMRRSIGKKDIRLENMFGTKMIQDVHFIPKHAKIKGLVNCFIKYPFYTPLAIPMMYYFAKFAKVERVDGTPIWKINKSTKKAITNGY